MTVDAEEADRLELSLDIIGAVFAASVAGRLERLRPRGAGVPEARAVRDRLAGRNRARRRTAAGACGWSRARTGIPKSSARRNWACRAIRSSRASRTPTCPTSPARASCSTPAPTAIYPQFATHNAHTIAAIHHIAHGPPVRIPAPARHGHRSVRRSDRREEPRTCRAASTRRSASHEDLLPYLVRRLLENGANTSLRQPHRRRRRARSRDLVADPAEIVRAFRLASRTRASRCRSTLYGSNCTEEFHGRQPCQRRRTERELADAVNAAQGPWNAAAAGARRDALAANRAT